MKGYCPFSVWKDIAGKPGTGSHIPTLLNVILLDNIVTIFAAIVVTYQFEIPFPVSIIGIYMIAILFHMLFGVQTQTLTYFGIRC